MGEITEQISVRLPVGVVETLRSLAAAQDRTLTQEVRRAVNVHIERAARAYGVADDATSD